MPPAPTNLEDMIDLRYVKKLIEMLDESSVDSIEISTEKGIKIHLAKTGASRGAAPVAPITVALPAPVTTDATRLTPMQGIQVVPEAPAPPPAPVVSAPVAKLLEVRSPMVGTFYGAPEPGAKPYAGVGDRVKKGQVLCIIEAMKIMNEIESEVEGVVREALAENAQPVEYGQVLFRVDPNG